MRWKYVLIVVILLLSCISALGARDAVITVTPLQDHISFGESALFQVRITNLERVQQKFSLYSLQSRGWNIDPQPLSDKIIVLPVGDTYTTKIRAQPITKYEPGIYYVAFSIDSDNGKSQELSLKVYLGPEKPIEYLPTIRATLDLDTLVNPGESIAATLFLENQNALDLSGLAVKIQSSVPEFNQVFPVALPPLDQKTVEFTLTPNKHLQPKDYKLFFVFEHEGQTIKVLEQELKVATLVPEFDVAADEDTIFFKTRSKITITNSGNVLNTQEARAPVSFFASLFTTSGGSFKTYKGQRYLVWEVSLKPGESITVESVTNYRLIFYVVVIVLLLAGFYSAVQAPVAIKKKAVTVRSEEEGALSEIKVTLELKNRSKKQLKDLEIIDLVPPIANIERSLELGTMKPKEIRHTKQGTKVIWSLPEFEVQEHRLITYNIRAKLNILGSFKLPRAEAHYGKRSGKKGKAYSNFLTLE